MSLYIVALLRNKIGGNRFPIRMRTRTHPGGFSLVELIVVVVILSLLASVSLPIYNSAIAHAHCATCASNMHGLSIAFLSYAYDHDGLLPGRVKVGDKWPSILLPYVGNDAKVYIDPGDRVATQVPLSQLVSDTTNNSSFIFNGFNDLGGLSNPNAIVSLFNVPSSGGLILLGQQIAGGDNFYLDVNNNDQNTVLNKQAYFGGANYGFADGSLRFMKVSDYNDSMWLVNQSYVIPGG